jgi:hypothetical protein
MKDAVSFPDQLFFSLLLLGFKFLDDIIHIVMIIIVNIIFIVYSL